GEKQRLHPEAEKEKAQPNVIDQAEIVATAATDRLVWIEWPLELSRLVDGRVDESRIAQVLGKLGTQWRKDRGVVGQPAISEDGFDDVGESVPVATMLHLRNCGTNGKERPTPGFRADLIVKPTVETDTKRCDERYANESNSEPRH